MHFLAQILGQYPFWRLFVVKANPPSDKGRRKEHLVGHFGTNSRRCQIGDTSINGHSIFVSGRKWATKGYMDLDLDDYSGNSLVNEIQEDQVKSAPVPLGLFVWNHVLFLDSVKWCESLQSIDYFCTGNHKNELQNKGTTRGGWQANTLYIVDRLVTLPEMTTRSMGRICPTYARCLCP